MKGKGADPRCRCCNNAAHIRCMKIWAEHQDTMQRGDGGDIQYRGYRDGVVHLQMQGACSGCPCHCNQSAWAAAASSLPQSCSSALEVLQGLFGAALLESKLQAE